MDRALDERLSRGLRETAMLALLVLAGYLLLSLFTYHPGDSAWSYTGDGDVVRNYGGIVGAWFADIALYLLGFMAYVVPVVLAAGGWILVHGPPHGADRGLHPTALRWFGLVLTVLAGASLASLHLTDPRLLLPQNAGGVLGTLLSDLLASMFSFSGATLFMLVVLVAGVTMLTGISWIDVVERTGAATLWVLDHLERWIVIARHRLSALRARRVRAKTVKAETQKVKKRKPPRIEPAVKVEVQSERVEREKQVPLFDVPMWGDVPPLALLDAPPPAEGGYSKETLQAMSRQVELKLRDFGIESEVVSVHPGPVITRFELQPAPGIKASRISGLATDLARALSVPSVRVVEVIPGKSVIGLEIPNEQREVIALNDTLKSRDYDDAKFPLALGLGKDISGKPVVVNLAKMPHLLVAGTTGSGKSVAINAMLLSLLFKSTPQEMRLILVDPKMLELSVYEGIPHLLTPVVTDMKQAANALRWAVAEMDRRYQLMASLGVRNIAGYNRKVEEAEKRGEPLSDPLYKAPELVEEDGQTADPPPVLTSLPYIVVIIDELADMMMLVGKKVEELIARLAQKARASGIHLILATQRPSVDVITGLIKSNIPTRIAFQVYSKIDSRTIIDQAGAEALLGNGDMLYVAPGTGLPARLHGAFVDDSEVHRVANWLREQGEPSYNEEILEVSEEIVVGANGGFEGAGEEDDPLYDQAVRIVTESRRASISAVQRRLKIGYNRAARMVESMEAAGVVGPLQANGSREVLAPPPPEV